MKPHAARFTAAWVFACGACGGTVSSFVPSDNDGGDASGSIADVDAHSDSTAADAGGLTAVEGSVVDATADMTMLQAADVVVDTPEPDAPNADSTDVATVEDTVTSEGAAPDATTSYEAAADGASGEVSDAHDADFGQDAPTDVVVDASWLEAGGFDAGPGWQSTDGGPVTELAIDDGGSAESATIACTRIATGGLVVDPSGRFLYATVPVQTAGPLAGFQEDSVIRIDPASLAVTEWVNVGSNPKALAISDDGASLYVGIDGEYSVQRVDVSTGALDPPIPLGPLTFPNQRVAGEIRAVPGSATRYVVSRNDYWSSAVGGLALFDGTTLLAESYPGNEAMSIAFTSPSTLFGYDYDVDAFDFFEFSVTSTGFSELLDSRQLVSGFGVKIESQGGWVFTTSGLALDGVTAMQVASYSVQGAVWADPAGSDVWYLGATSTTAQVPTLYDFDRSSATLKRSITLGGAAANSYALDSATTTLVGLSSTEFAFTDNMSEICVLTVPPAADSGVGLDADTQ